MQHVSVLFHVTYGCKSKCSDCSVMQRRWRPMGTSPPHASSFRLTIGMFFLTCVFCLVLNHFLQMAQGTTLGLANLALVSFSSHPALLATPIHHFGHGHGVLFSRHYLINISIFHEFFIDVLNWHLRHRGQRLSSSKASCAQDEVHWMIETPMMERCFFWPPNYLGKNDKNG